MSVSVIVPFRGDGAERSRNWGWNERRWQTMNVELVVEGADAGGGQFGSAAAKNRAAARASGNVLVLCDADTAISGSWVKAAVSLVYSGRAAWVLAENYAQLTADASARAVLRAPYAPIVETEFDWVGEAVSWAPPVVVSRHSFEAIGGYDERFRGWGADDVMLAMALDTLVGPHRRLIGCAFHLWHSRNGLDAQPAEQHQVMERYIAAHGDTDAMRELLDEVR